MNIYHYDRNTFEYLGSDEAKPSPLEPDAYLVPAFATINEPPLELLGENQTCIFDAAAESWSIVADFRGIEYYLPDGSYHQITALNIIVPNDGTDTPPPPALETVKAQKLAEMEVAARNAILAGFDSDALGTTHHYGGKETDQLNLIGAVSTGADMGYPCADLGDVWDRRTHTSAQLKQVVVDGAVYKQTVLVALDLRRVEIDAAVDSDAVNSVVWGE